MSLGPEAYFFSKLEQNQNVSKTRSLCLTKTQNKLDNSLKLLSFFNKKLNYLLKYSFNLVYSSNFD